MTSKIKKTKMTATQQEAFMARAAKRIHLSDADLAAFKEKYGEASLYLMQSALLFKNINQNLDTKVGSSVAAVRQMLNQDLSAAQIAKITGLSEQDIASMLPAEKATSAQPAQTNTVTQSTPEVSATQPKVSTKEQTWQALLTAQKEQSANCGPLLQSIFGKTAISTEEDMKLAKTSLDNFISAWHKKTQPTLTDYVAYLTQTVEQAKVNDTRRTEMTTTPPTNTRTISADALYRSSMQNASTATQSSTPATDTDDTKSAMERDAVLSKVAPTTVPTTTATISADALENAATAQNRLSSRVDATANTAGTNTPVVEEATQTASDQAKQAFIDNAYAQISQNGSDTEQTLKELLDSGYITKADIQTVLQNNPELFQDIKEGTFNKKLAKQADKVKGKPQGRCLGGVQTTFARAGYSQYLAGCNFPSKKRKKGDSSNAACDLPYAIENYCARTGQQDSFIRITLSNDSNINTTLKYLPAGQVFSFSNKEGCYANNGNIYGHTAITTNSGTYASDGVQYSINGARYGRDVSIMLRTDNISTEELTQALLAQAYDRQENERMLAAAQTQQNSTTLAAVATKQNERS